MLKLRFEAPFAAFRTFTAGSFRPTAGFMTPSAAYGLLLNIAGVEMRFDDQLSSMTLIRSDLPVVSLAIAARSVDGRPALPARHSLLQQLHNYPVGSSAKERAAQTMGNKYNIVPVRRDLLSDLRGYIAVDGNNDLEQAIVRGLTGSGSRAYGLPFVGDNNFLLDRLAVVTDAPDAAWYVRIGAEEAAGMREAVTRMTISIDRKDMSRTVSALFEPHPEPGSEVPKAAWVMVPSG